MQPKAIALARHGVSLIAHLSFRLASSRIMINQYDSFQSNITDVMNDNH